MNFTERDLQLKQYKYYVYIMASRSLNLYTGVTNSIFRRVLQHKSGDIEGFTKRYHQSAGVLRGVSPRRECNCL